MPGVFTIRAACPACRRPAADAECLYECPYDRPPVADYLRRYYDAIGFIETEPLREATYRLLRCPGCALVYQQEVPADALLERLYEHWIDPPSALSRDRRRHGLGHYSMHAQEILQLRIEHAATLGIPVVDAQRLNGERFDLVNAEQVFEHLPRQGTWVVFRSVNGKAA